MVMMRPEVTAGPIDRARSPEKVSVVTDCEKTGTMAMTATMIDATTASRFITSLYTWRAENAM